MNRKDYEEDLKRRQDEHLRHLDRNGIGWQPCMHDQCPECIGTGRKINGSSCVHMISCPCPKCTPRC